MSKPSALTRSPLELLCIVLAAIVLGGCAADDDNGKRGTFEYIEQEPTNTVFNSTDLRERFDNIGGYAVSGVLEAHDGATRGGFLVDTWTDLAGIHVDLEVRGVYEDGATTDWVRAEVTWEEAPHFVARADLGDLVHATQIRLPVDQIDRVNSILYGAVIPAESENADADDSDRRGVGQVQQGLTSELSGVVESRAKWGARATRCSSRNTSKHRMAIHHTYTPADTSGSFERRLRGIQAYHMDSNGWCDVGYHFLVTADGRVWEGRPLHLLGSHTRRNNTGNVGISYVGCFHPDANCNRYMTSTRPPEAAIDGGARIVKKISEMYGIAINSTNVKGHKHHSGQSTACPGDFLVARLDDIRSRAKGGSSTPPPPPPGEPPPPANAGRALGVVWDLASASSPTGSGNRRITNATVSVDGVASTTVRSSDGFFALSLPAGRHTITASAPGFQSSTRTVDISSGGDSWASVGLSAGSSISELTVRVIGESSQALSGATTYIPGLGVKRTGADGTASFTIDASSTDLQVFHTGYGANTQTVALSGGPQTLTVQLLRAAPPSSTGRLQGVVWDRATASSPSSSSAKRLDDATILCSCGQAVKARAGDAYWRIDAPPGTHTFTVVASGYTTESFQHRVTTGASDWGSMSLSR